MQITVEYEQELETADVAAKISQLASPHVILWYIGIDGLKKSCVSFYRDELIMPVYNANQQAQFWLLDLTAWKALKSSAVDISQSSCHIPKLQGLDSERLHCFKSSDVFKKMQAINDNILIAHFHKVLAKRHVWQGSLNAPKSDISLRALFQNNCALIAPFYDQDANMSYSMLQYLEGFFLINEVVQTALHERKANDIEIAFLLPNDELKYYQNDENSFGEDLAFFMKQIYGADCQLNVKVKFLSFKYGKSISDRPYNAPGHVIKKNELSHEYFFKSDCPSFETITENLLIRPYQPEDFENSVTLYGDARLMRHFNYGVPLSRQKVEALVEKDCRLFKKGLPFGLFSIFHRQTGRFVGHLDCLPHENDPATLELGIILNRAYHGTGFAHEAGHAFLYEFLIKCRQQFGKEIIQRVTATAHPKNKPSIKLIEKNGLRFKENITRFGQPRAVYLLTFPD